MDEVNKYDIAIIGGGLAGLSLAIQAASKNYKVILFEKEQYPFHKVCGEYVSMESWNFLLGLGMPLDEMMLPLIHNLQISDSKGNSYDYKLQLGGFGISRFLLDNGLYKIALQRGVDVQLKTKVTDVRMENNHFEILTTEGNFFAKTAAGTFGKRSNLDIKWHRQFAHQKTGNLTNYIAVKYHVYYPQPKDLIALHNFENGYCGVSAIEENKCCLCYLTTAENLRKSDNSIAVLEKNILGKNPVLHHLFNTAEFLYDQPLTISQISFLPKSQIINHVLLAGDAAGMITPLCGNGMSMALHAGKLAFEAIHDFLQQKITQQEMETTYIKKWRSVFQKRLFTGRLVQRFFGQERSTSLFLKVMNHSPFLASKVIRATHGTPF